MKKPPALSDAEWQVMRTLWSQRNALMANELHELLQPSTGWSLATTKTLLNRLVNKGALRYTKEGRAHRYESVFAEEEHRKGASEGFLKRIFDGAFAPMMAHFIQSQPLSAEEIKELELLLRKKKPPKP